MIEYIMIAVIATVIGFTFGAMFGSHLERIEWNKMIDQGKIPKPKNLPKNHWGRE